MKQITRVKLLGAAAIQRKESVRSSGGPTEVKEALADIHVLERKLGEVAKWESRLAELKKRRSVPAANP